MSFREKTTVVMLLILGFVFGSYFISAIGAYRAGETSVEGLSGVFVGLVVTIIVYSVIGNIVLGILGHKQLEEEGESDERDKLIDLRGSSFGGIVLSVGIVGTLIALFARDADHFVIAHALLGSLVASEILSSLYKLYLYRTGL